MCSSDLVHMRSTRRGGSAGLRCAGVRGMLEEDGEGVPIVDDLQRGWGSGWLFVGENLGCCGPTVLIRASLGVVFLGGGIAEHGR